MADIRSLVTHGVGWNDYFRPTRPYTTRRIFLRRFVHRIVVLIREIFGPKKAGATRVVQERIEMKDGTELRRRRSRRRWKRGGEDRGGGGNRRTKKKMTTYHRQS